MDSSKIAALASPKPPTIASRRPMLASQRSFSALSINTGVTHADMTRRNSSASIASKHRKLQTPTNMPPLPLSANNSSCMSPEELSSKIADSFQQFSSMLSQLSNSKSASNIALAPVTPPLVYKHNPSINSNNTSGRAPSETKRQLSPQKLPSPPFLNPVTSPTRLPTQSSNRKVLRPLAENCTNLNSSQDYEDHVLDRGLVNTIPERNIPSDKESESDDDILSDGGDDHAVYCDDVLKVIERPVTAINKGNTRLRQRVISKWFIRAASIGDTITMQKMINSITDMDVNCIEDKKTGITALMYAAYFGQINCLSLLLNHPKLSLNQQDKKGWTALMWAINSSQIEAIQMLLDKGAEKNLKTHYGRTVYDFSASTKVKDLLGSPPHIKDANKQPVEDADNGKTLLVPGSNTSETECKSNRSKNVTVEVDYYQTTVSGYGQLLRGPNVSVNADSKKILGTTNLSKGSIEPPDFSQLTKTITSPQQEQRKKEIMQSLQTAACNNSASEDEDLKHWEASIKSSSTFSWNQCLPDQMFVFSQDDVHLILDQALSVTDAKSLMNMGQSNNELWRPANVIFLSARFAHYCSSRELLNNLLHIVIAKLSRVLKTNHRDIYSLAYWIANICQLSSYLKKDPGLCVSTSEVQESLSALISEAYFSFVAETQKKIEKILEVAMMEYESIHDMEHIDFADDWQRFFRRSSTNHGRKSTDIANNIERKRSLDSTSSTTMSSNNIANDSTSSVVTSPHSITGLVGTVQSTLQAYYVPPAIVIQAIAQFFHYLSCELFNRVLTYKKYLCRSKALQIRMNLSTMEEWVRNNRLPSSLNNAFDPLIQLLQLLQCLSQMDDVVLFSSTVQTFDKLNPLQVKRCVQNYRYEVSESRLPEEVEQLACQMAQEYQQQQSISIGNRGNGNNNKIIQTRASMDSIGGGSSYISTIGSKGVGRPASISSLNCLLTTATGKKRLSAEELLTLNSSTVQQLDDEIDDEDSRSEKRNSSYVLPFSIPITIALLQDWTEEKHKKSVNKIGDSSNYSEMIYQEIKSKKLEQLDLMDKIYPTVSEEWLYHLDKRLCVK